MSHRRRERARPSACGVVFTAPGGGLRDPSNTQSDLRSVFDAAGFEWVTSHVCSTFLAVGVGPQGIEP